MLNGSRVQRTAWKGMSREPAVTRKSSGSLGFATTKVDCSVSSDVLVSSDQHGMRQSTMLTAMQERWGSRDIATEEE